MKKQLLSEELLRMKRLAGIISENHFDYNPGDHYNIDVTKGVNTRVEKERDERKEKRYEELKQKVVSAWNKGVEKKYQGSVVFGGITFARKAYDEIKDEVKKLGEFKYFKANNGASYSPMQLLDEFMKTLEAQAQAQAQAQAKANTPQQPEKKSILQKVKGFVGLKEEIKIDTNNYELPDLEAKKEALSAMFPTGEIDKSHYEHFGRESEEDLENSIESGEIGADNITNAAQWATEEVFPESEGFTVESGMYSGDEKCYVTVSKGEDYLKFDLSVGI